MATNNTRPTICWPATGANKADRAGGTSVTMTVQAVAVRISATDTIKAVVTAKSMATNMATEGPVDCHNNNVGPKAQARPLNIQEPTNSRRQIARLFGPGAAR